MTLDEIFKITDPTQRIIQLHAACSQGEFSKLSDSEKVVVTVEDFESEVMNGGFRQYFANYAGDNWEYALRSLEAIGAPKAAALLRDALSVFPNSMPSTNHEQRASLVDTLATSEKEKLNSLDQAFAKYEENLGDLVLAYAESHRGDFRPLGTSASKKEGFLARLFGR